VAQLLVVDDEPHIRRYLNGSLSAQGHTIYEAADGQDALNQLRFRDFNLVPLDLAMPGRSGLQVLSELRQRESHTPVIVLTAVSDISARIQALAGGAVDMVAKPFSSAELTALIRRHLPPHQTPSAPDEPDAAQQQRVFPRGTAPRHLRHGLRSWQQPRSGLSAPAAHEAAARPSDRNGAR
jgi:two-component system KDP operon response regulator KdpE